MKRLISRVVAQRHVANLLQRIPAGVRREDVLEVRRRG